MGRAVFFASFSLEKFVQPAEVVAPVGAWVGLVTGKCRTDVCNKNSFELMGIVPIFDEFRLFLICEFAELADVFCSFVGGAAQAFSIFVL